LLSQAELKKYFFDRRSAGVQSSGDLEISLAPVDPAAFIDGGLI